MRAAARGSFLRAAAVVGGVGCAGSDPQFGQRFAGLVGRRLLRSVDRGIAVAGAADDRSEKDEEEGERKPRQPDPDALCAAAGLIRHRADEAMARFDTMQARTLTAA